MKASRRNVDVDAEERERGPKLGPCPTESCVRCAGGWIPIVISSKRNVAEGRKARIVTVLASCNCDMGYWQFRRGQIFGPKCNTYADLPKRIKEHYDLCKTMQEISALNRLREVEIKKKLDMPYFDYETYKYNGFPEYKKSLRGGGFKPMPETLAGIVPPSEEGKPNEKGGDNHTGGGGEDIGHAPAPTQTDETEGDFF